MSNSDDHSRYDIAIIGAGFAGSILAQILAKHGRSVALIDAAEHPRFAIGESSTPIADKILKRLGEKHDIETFVQLASYGDWQRNHPDVTCGLKRGFSYFSHQQGKPFRLQTANSLLVAASASDDVSDTHWYRSEVDEFLFDQAALTGVSPLSNHRVTGIEPDDWIRITLDDNGVIESRIAIDASGPSCVMARFLKATNLVRSLDTHTRSTFAHFSGVKSWSADHSRYDDPFNGDHAAQHHLLGDDGWMWMLRFDNDVTSVGVTSQGIGSPEFPATGRYPSIDAMFAGAEQLFPAPPDSPITTSRLQRFYDPIAAPNCWMLPTAAVSIDPLHSTGIAHALAGIDRLADMILAQSGESSDLGVGRLAIGAEMYAHGVRREALFLDSLVATAYNTMDDFPRFTVACMLYFAAAIACEESYQRGDTPSRLFNADDEEFVSVIQHCAETLAGNGSTEAVTDSIRHKLEPYNTAGLLDDAVNNRYRYTATKT
ncbi:MAG: tryptophan 7-halogenase [Pirellulaceae bacterium]